MKLIFCLQINTKVFIKLLVSLWLYVARHVQSSQNNKIAISQDCKIAISLQFLKENVKDIKGFVKLIPSF